MSLTKCPDCRHLCFTEALSCPTCGRAFEPGSLGAKHAAEEKSFRRRGRTVFLAALVILFGLLLSVILRDDRAASAQSAGVQATERTEAR